jgi:hypothetical protein
MAITTKKKYTGQESTSVLNGQLRIEDGNNRMVLYDGTDYRMILGVLPDGTIGMVISKPGIDVFSVFT